MRNPFRLIYKAIQSSILCIRFPFLYPRNRFTGLHYNNWRIKKYCSKLIEKYKYSIISITGNEKDGFSAEYMGSSMWEKTTNVSQSSLVNTNK